MPILGRPREFDRDTALQAAMLVFWRKGFVATSMNDLCDAMGIRSPSLYAAFGSKESLYIEAIQWYTKTVRPRIWDRLEEGPSARNCVKKFLMTAAKALPGDAEAPLGCMVSMATIGEECPEAIQEAVKNARLDGLHLLRSRLEAAVADGELPRSTDVNRLSRFYLGVFQGMSIQARDGATRAELEGMAKPAMLAWPGA